jgi:hypothetical protein
LKFEKKIIIFMFWYEFNFSARPPPPPHPDISPSMLVFEVMLQSARANALKAQSTSLKPSATVGTTLRYLCIVNM